jgi:hypothetical protein
MSTRSYHLGTQQIPDGFQIFEDRLEIAGVGFRKEDAAAFATATDGWLELERDPANVHDQNAIKVIGCTKNFFGAKRRFIGYVPKEVSRLIVEGGYLYQIRPRLLKTYVGDQGFVEILFQILGPIGQKYHFLQTRASEGTHYTDYVDRVKQLIAEEKLEDAIQLLLTQIDATETEARKGGGVAPWYYEKLAIVYRKQRRYADEIAILERFDSQPKAPGALPAKLAERLVKAKQFMRHSGP